MRRRDLARLAAAARHRAVTTSSSRDLTRSPDATDRRNDRSGRPTRPPTDRPTRRPIARQNDRPIHRPTDRATDRPTDRLTERPTDRKHLIRSIQYVTSFYLGENSTLPRDTALLRTAVLCSAVLRLPFAPRGAVLRGAALRYMTQRDAAVMCSAMLYCPSRLCGTV